MIDRAVTNSRVLLVLALVTAVSIPVAFVASRSPFLALAAVVGIILYVVFLRWPMFGILAVVFLLPFERIGAVDVAGVTVRPSQVVAIALIAAWLTRSAWRGKIHWRPQPLLIPLSVYLIILGIGLTHAENLTRGLFVFAFTAFTLAVSILMPQLVRTEAQANRVVNVLLITTAIVSAFGLFQFLGDYAGLPTSITGLRDLYTKAVLGFPRVQSTALEPLYFANFLLLPLSLLTASLFSRSQRQGFFGLPLLLLAGLVLVLTVARGGYLAFAASVVVIIAFSLRQFLHPGRILAFGASILIVGVVAMQLLGGGTDAFSAKKFTEHITNLFTGASYEERIATFDLANQAFHEQPLVGIGPGQFGPYASINPSYEPKDGWKIVNNLTLEVLAEAGMLGLIALALAFFVLIVRSVQAIRRARSPNLRALLVGGLAAVIGILVQYQTFSILYIMHVWVAVGLLVSFQNLVLAPARE
ncbi:MAG: O-antigen ligase family protein [bacterium]|nr:O-antigen ligase family protein [bacterium]